MGLLQNPKQFLISLFFLNMLFTPHCSSDHTDYVYKGCANQKFQDPSGIYSQNLNNLFDTLSFQSSSVKFYKTTAGQGQTAINGLFQCRGDLSNSDCKDCVSKIPGMSKELCGGEVVAARIQLEGCYLRYEIAGFKQVSSTELLFKICGSSQSSDGSDFEQKLDTAFGEIAKGIGGGNGFYSGESQAVNVLGQCEEDLLGSGGDCVNCVKTAAQKAKSECLGAISAQIYLQQCFITYSNGVSTKSTTSSSGGGGIKANTQKTIAIVFGGVVAVGLVFACLLYARSVYTKRKFHTKYAAEGYY